MKRVQYALALIALLLAACSSAPPSRPDAGPAPGPAPARPGAYYQDDGPATPPVDLASVPDAQPRLEPLRAANSRPYVVAGKRFTPMQRLEPFREEGVGSWYGRQFHGRPTAIGERYDMHAMTAAHPTLPLPSYARVTHLGNGRSVVVRVNDRGPFLHGRIIDLSYAAAWKLGYVEQGSARLRVELIVPGATEPTPVQAALPAPVPTPSAAPAAAAPPPAAVAPAPGSYYLQLGVFASRVNADALMKQIRDELGWLRHEVFQQPAGNAVRVRVGPFANAAEAQGTSARIGAALKLKPLLVR
jgi:rare lipoprotein A